MLKFRNEDVNEEMSDGFDYLGKLTGRLCVMYLIRR
jgi:hypothetical protein